LSAPEVSVVIPCLDEADTVVTCVEKALRALDSAGIAGEVVVADNGSSDGSDRLAREAGARVVAVAERGYGSALMAGISEARGTYVVMGDADDSYDFLEVPRFVEKLREGHDLVQGCRLPGGGGRVLPGAMPFLHRWVGNPLFSLLGRLWFSAPVHDLYCGMRGFRRELPDQLQLRCTGMEYAVEMIVKATLAGARIAEAPITLHTDGRLAHAPHLNTFRDGWRTLRFLLLYSPRWLFLLPAAVLGLFGALGYAIALPGMRIGGIHFDVSTLLVSSLALICALQCGVFFLITRTFAAVEGLLPEDPRLDRFFEWATLEKGIAIGGTAVVVGLVLLGAAVNQWRLAEFGPLDYPSVLRWVIPGATLVALGVQGTFASFVVSLFGVRRR
jgi:hypothetical protein